MLFRILILLCLIFLFSSTEAQEALFGGYSIFYNYPRNNTIRYCDGVPCNGFIVDSTYVAGIRLANYKDGMLHGPYTTYYDDGTLWGEGYYKRNRKVGEWSWYEENGNVKEAFVFSYSCPLGEVERKWFNAGLISEWVKMDSNDCSKDFLRSYDENGLLTTEQFFYGDTLGYYERAYEEGEVLSYIGKWLYGENGNSEIETGTWVLFDAKGKPNKEVIYQDGIALSVKPYEDALLKISELKKVFERPKYE